MSEMKKVTWAGQSLMIPSTVDPAAFKAEMIKYFPELKDCDPVVDAAGNITFQKRVGTKG